MSDKLKERLIELHANPRGPIRIDEALARELESREERDKKAPLPTSSKKSSPRAKPVLDPQHDALEATEGLPEKRRSGRPAYYPPWLKPAAYLVANGYTLRRALWRLGVSIPESQLRQVYRWKLFRHDSKQPQSADAEFYRCLLGAPELR